MSRLVVRAAGGVLWRGDRADPEVALVHRPRYDDWSLPKGKAKPAEHLLVTALREVQEETGSQGLLGPMLTTTHYAVVSHGRPADKFVTYWAIRDTGGSFEPTREVDDLQWLAVPEARETLTKEADVRVLDTFTRAPRDTRPLVLLRHAATTSQSSKRGAKRQLLSRTGRDQAAALVPLLRTIGADGLLSAATVACRDTLRPYGRTAGVGVEVDPRLDRATFGDHEHAVAEDLRREGSQKTLVVCGSRRVIADLVSTLSRDSLVRPPHDGSVRKGGWWLLHLQDGSVSAYERHEPAA